jgi:hypothetical protein
MAFSINGNGIKEDLHVYNSSRTVLRGGKDGKMGIEKQEVRREESASIGMNL